MSNPAAEARAIDARVVQAAESLSRARAEIGRAVLGYDDIIRTMMTSIVAGGHILVEGVPGLAKTFLVRSTAAVLGIEQNRIQCTPDLMPSDITGSEILVEDPATGRKSFEFIRGPLFTNFLLVDEINRTPPKTQAALLEAMGEGQVTIGGKKYSLDNPFITMATQNPADQQGTYPLPEAQYDRFLLKILFGYTDAASEEAMMIARSGPEDQQVRLQPILSKEGLIDIRKLVREIVVDHNEVKAISRIIQAARPGGPGALPIVTESVEKMRGPGPRASIGFMLAARASALLDGRSLVQLSDVIDVAQPILRHRLKLTFQAQNENNLTPDILVNRIIEDLKLKL